MAKSSVSIGRTTDRFDFSARALPGLPTLPAGPTLPLVKMFLTVLIALLMFATLAVLIAGMVGLVRGGGDPRRSNQLMRWRIILQGAALLLFAILMGLLKS